MQNMTLGSLFDGLGTFPLAGALWGITPVWASEIEPAAIRVTKARFPEMMHLGDIRGIDGAKIQPVDIITGGSPCTNLSTAGNRQGLQGNQSSLFFEMIRIIHEMRNATNGRYPRYVVWENVPGAFTSNKGADFETVIAELIRIKDPAFQPSRPAHWQNAGAVLADTYHLEWRTLDAQYFGVPQLRRRIFLVADYGRERQPGLLKLFEPAGMRWNPVPDETQADAKDANGNSFLILGDAGDDWDAVAEREYFGNRMRHIGNNVIWRLLRRAITDGDVPPVSIPTGYTNVYSSAGAISHTSTKAYFCATFRDHQVGSLTACDYKMPPIVMEEFPDGCSYARRLSPRECLRLQGMPGKWCDNVEPPVSKKDIYRMAGNGIALPCAEWVLFRIVEENQYERDQSEK